MRMIRICNTLILCTKLHENKTFLLKVIYIFYGIDKRWHYLRIRILCIRSLYKRRMLCFFVIGTEDEADAVAGVVAAVVADVVAAA